MTPNIKSVTINIFYDNINNMEVSVIEKLKNKNLCYFLVTILYSVITLLCVLNHEVMTDEIQVWQLCKYLSIPELINHLHNEGHPILFYLLIMPFAKLSSNILYMQLLCWLACCISVFILLKYAPFKIYTKLSLILSAGFVYFLPVIARSYSILPILIFLAAILYLKQKQHPILYGIILVCIANTHAIMLGFVAILFFFFIKDIIKFKLYNEKKSYFISAVVIFIGLCLVVFQLHDTTSSNFFIKFRESNEIIRNIIWVLVNFFVNAGNYVALDSIGKIPGRNTYISDVFLGITIFANFILIFVNLFVRNKRLFLISTCAIIFQLMIYIFVYPILYI